MARVCGKEQKEIAMLDSGVVEKLMVLEYMFGSMVIVTKDNLDRI